MPCVTVHLQLARRVLDDLESRPAAAPFDPSDPSQADAFYQGAFGPDLGYMPGGLRLSSDLAHCLDSGDLTRALLRRSRTPRERAFAWGWVTHVLADQWIHPLVARAVGELVYGSGDCFAYGDRHPIAHVRVEAGLDAVFAERHPELRRWRFRPVFDSSSIEGVSGAFDDVYGGGPTPAALLSSHVGAARRARQGVALAAFTARHLPTHLRPERTGVEPQPGPVSRLRTVLGGRSVVFGFMLPVLPPSWFLDAVHQVEHAFVGYFNEQLETGAAGLENLNLDTGRPQFDDPTHGGLRRSLAYVASLRDAAVPRCESADRTRGDEGGDGTGRSEGADRATRASGATPGGDAGPIDLAGAA